MTIARTLVSAVLALSWSALAVSGAVHFEGGNWRHTVAAWALAGLLYLTWRQVR